MLESDETCKTARETCAAARKTAVQDECKTVSDERGRGKRTAPASGAGPPRPLANLFNFSCRCAYAQLAAGCVAYTLHSAHL